MIDRECLDYHVVTKIFDVMKSRCQMIIPQEVFSSLDDLSELDYFCISLDAWIAKKTSEIHQIIARKDSDAY